MVLVIDGRGTGAWCVSGSLFANSAETMEENWQPFGKVTHRGERSELRRIESFFPLDYDETGEGSPFAKFLNYVGEEDEEENTRILISFSGKTFGHRKC